MKHMQCVIALMLLMLAAPGALAEEGYQPFPGAVLKVAFWGEAESVSPMVTDWLKTQYADKTVEVKTFGGVEQQAQVTDFAPDLIYLGMRSSGERNGQAALEQLVRSLIAQNPDRILIWLDMPDEPGFGSEITAYYNLPVAEVSSYFERRVKAGVVSADTLLSGGQLTEEGKKLAAACITQFYQTRLFYPPVYRAVSLTGISDGNEQAVDQTPAEEKMLSAAEIERIFSEAVVLRFYKNTAVVKGESVRLDSRRPDAVAFPVNREAYVPVRFVKELGGKVSWSAKESVLTLSQKDKTLRLSQDSVESRGFILRNGVTYVPASAVCELLGKKYLSENGSALLYTAPGNLSASQLEQLTGSLAQKEGS